MPRFTSPHHKAGDFLDAPEWLVDEGRKLLGYLDQQRRVSGVKTISQTRDFPDGSQVTAAFFGDVPKVTYRFSPPESGEKVEETIEVRQPTKRSASVSALESVEMWIGIERKSCSRQRQKGGSRNLFGLH